MSEQRYLVWSNQHGAWWRAHRRGYTMLIEEAGRYTRERAAEIVRQSTLGGTLTRQGFSTVTGDPITYVDEVMVLAPESTDA